MADAAGQDPEEAMKKRGVHSSLEPWDVEMGRVDNGVTAYAGLPGVIEGWYALGLDKACQRHVRLRDRQKGLSDAEWAEVLTVLLMAGGRSLEDLEALKSDAGLCRMWPLLKKASARSELNYLHRFQDAKMPQARQGRARMVPEAEGLRGLAEVNRHLIRELQRWVSEEEATVDVDASIHESQKREKV